MELSQESEPRRWKSSLSKLAWGASGLGLVVFAGVLAFTTFGEVRRLTRVVPPTPPEVAHDVVVRNVRDDVGRSASFRILLFSDEFRWRLNSYRQLESTDTPAFTDAMKAVLNDAKEIICVGTSSEELPVGVSAQDGSASEEWRAARRAEQIAVWVRASLEKPVPVRKLNAGYHAATSQKRTADTSDQRRVVIILVLDHDDGTNIDEALRSAMLKEHDRAPIFETLLTRYSLAKGPAFSWVP